MICDLVFAHPRHFLSPGEELERYQHHNNDVEDPGYRSFLSKLYIPMIKRIAVNSMGLDFGSGPGPLLKLMLEEQGHNMSIYDIHYAPDKSVFERQYDFITSTETVEHLYKPMEELDRLWGCLKPGGILGIMTGLRHKNIDFAKWHYIRDDTHVVFFSPDSFCWLGEHWGTAPEFIGDSVILFQKEQFA